MGRSCRLVMDLVILVASLFFFALVFPYLLIAGMAWISARVVYRLGREVQRARRLGSYRPGDSVTVTVWRDGETSEVQVRLDACSDRSEGQGLITGDVAILARG